MSAACELLHRRLSRLPRLGGDFSPDDLPTNGVYVMFERGERAHGVDRIVRVGTHSGGSNLPKRLREHFQTPNKDRSIFRKHVGRCLLASRRDPFLEQWEVDLTTRAARERHGGRVDQDRLQAVEQEVSAYLAGNLTFVVLPVERKADRVAVERGLLSTVASCGGCHPSDRWLGRHHKTDTVRRMGLWNVQGLKGRPLAVEEVEGLPGRWFRGSAR